MRCTKPVSKPCDPGTVGSKNLLGEDKNLSDIYISDIKVIGVLKIY